MKRIGILAVRTLNYGSLLQSYATQEIVKDLGYDCDIILYKKTNMVKQGLRLLDKDVRNNTLRSFHKKIYIKTHGKELQSYFSRKTAALVSFIDEYFKSSPEYRGRKALLAAGKEYDAYLLGSDQVWNPMNYGGDYFSMSWVPNDKVKIAYAASFGVTEIPKYQIKKTKRDLARIEYISVRETSGQKLIKNLIGRDVPVVADPTILANRRIWDDLKGDRLIKKDYIMCYFLGNNPNHRKLAEELSKKTGLPIVTLPHGDEIVKADFGFGEIKPQGVGPAEFVNLISNAKYVCTDSFHGTVFSILYKRQFMVFNRYTADVNGKSSTNSRLSSLLNLLGLENRLYDSNKGVKQDMFEPINFETAHNNIEKLREQSLAYLKNALSDSRI